jgi:UDP-N-acetylglucosamine--N-acetylmuramyl-(pentapeptide) pyrophosphoryl-undecaprenol N-acetylglucosamine transferase
MEQGLVARESNLPFQAIHAAAVRGRGPKDLARNSVLIARGIWEARALIQRERPAAVLGTGGYVCFPLLAAARMLGVPTMIYSPDIVPGLAVKSLSRIATRVACSFEPSLRYLPREKTVVTGYPVRPDLFTLDKTACRRVFGITAELPVLLVYGGSRGARSLNRAVEALLPELLSLAQIIHVCGREGDETWLRTAAERLSPELQARYHLFPYLHGGQGTKPEDKVVEGTTVASGPTMVEALGAADLAVARAGASTLAELPAARLPAVLVPLVVVKQDENANYLAQRGAAVSVADDAMLGPGLPAEGPLFREVRRLLLDAPLREQMAQRSAALARPDAASDIADQLLSLTRLGRLRS